MRGDFTKTTFMEVFSLSAADCTLPSPSCYAKARPSVHPAVMSSFPSMHRTDMLRIYTAAFC